ncbi:MAG: hypothetical protein V3W26_04615, partial [Thermodesulfobacteriota bacterium]
LDSLFLITMGVGYLLAMAYLYTSHEMLDGRPGLSVDDVAYTYYGSRSGTTLEAALRGSMSSYAPFEEREEIIKWIYSGSPDAEYHNKIKPIVDRRCIPCHKPEASPMVTSLSTKEEIGKLTRVDMGKSIGELAKVSHIHLFGVGVIFFIMGKIFILCELPIIFKRIVVAIPFMAIAMDIGSWWLTHWQPLFAYVVIIGGALMGLSIAFQITISIYQMWFYKYPKDKEVF